MHASYATLVFLRFCPCQVIQDPTSGEVHATLAQTRVKATVMTDPIRQLIVLRQPTVVHAQQA